MGLMSIQEPKKNKKSGFLLEKYVKNGYSITREQGMGNGEQGKK